MREKQEDISIQAFFSQIEDPRVERTKRHKLIDIIVIAVCAIICGAEGWESMQTYGESKKEWLETLLELPNGIPGHDTFRRVFERIQPEAFKDSFVRWVEAVFEASNGDIIPIDGKTVRGSYDKGNGKGAIHMVSAWSTQNQIVLGQMKTQEKSNEITAIPALIDIIDLHGGIVTIDAMGCQKDIASKIVSKGGDYVLAVKNNQKTLYEDIRPYFDELKQKKMPDCDFYKTVEKGHGRIETRKFWSVKASDWLNAEHPEWKNLQSIGLVESSRLIHGKETIQRRYYICSIPFNASLFAKATRAHWAIENSLHWVLDVTFREDQSRIRSKNSPENLAILRHVIVNLVRQEKSFKRGAPQKRLRAACDNAYLEKILAS